MSVVQAVLERFAHRARTGCKAKLTFRVDRRIAARASQFIEKLLDDGPDGDCYRQALGQWRSAERPVIETHFGTTSWLRIDGPHWGPDGVALGALLQSPGVTAHLNPAETALIREQIAESIERVILDWIKHFDLQEQLPVEAAVDRSEADPLAKAVIRQFPTPERLKAACILRLPLLSYRGKHHG